MSDKYNDVFPTRLRQLIEEKPTTITAVARELGISRQAVSQYTMGIGQPNADKLLQMAEFFDVSVDWLVGRQGGAKSFDMNMDGACRFLDMDEESVTFLRELGTFAADKPGVLRQIFTDHDFQLAVQSILQYKSCMNDARDALKKGEKSRAESLWRQAQYIEYYMAMGSVQEMLNGYRDEDDPETVIQFEEFARALTKERKLNNG